MDCENRQRRSRGLKLAALTSLICKAGNILLQIVAIPMALWVLGEQRYGVFAAVNVLLSAVLITDFGIGPGLTNALAKKLANEDRFGSQRDFSTAFWMVAGLGGLGCGLAALLIAVLPMESVFGKNFAQHASDLRLASFLGLAILFARMLASVVERARAAYQETFVNNLFGAIGNLVSAIVLIVGIRTIPQPWFIILAVNGGLALAGIANAIHFFTRHPDLVPVPSYWRGSVAKFLLLDGLGFCAIMSIAPIARTFGCSQILGRIDGPGAVSVFDMFIRLSTFVYGFVVMFTFPLWPALSDAAARQDVAWISLARRRLYTLAAIYIGAMTIGLSTMGQQAIDLWLKGKIHVDHWLLFCFCLSFGISIWHHVHHIFLVALDDVRWVSWAVCLEIPFYLLFAAVGFRMSGLAGLFLGVTFVGLILSFIFPFRASRKLASLQGNCPNHENPIALPAHG